MSAIADALRFVEIGIMWRELDVVDAHLEALVFDMLVGSTAICVHSPLVWKKVHTILDHDGSERFPMLFLGGLVALEPGVRLELLDDI